MVLLREAFFSLTSSLKKCQNGASFIYQRIVYTTLRDFLFWKWCVHVSCIKIVTIYWVMHVHLMSVCHLFVVFLFFCVFATSICISCQFITVCCHSLLWAELKTVANKIFTGKWWTTFHCLKQKQCVFTKSTILKNIESVCEFLALVCMCVAQGKDITPSRDEDHVSTATYHMLGWKE